MARIKIMEPINNQTALRNNNKINCLKKISQKSLKYLFCLSLLFWFSCSDSSEPTPTPVPQPSYTGSLNNVHNIDVTFAGYTSVKFATTRVGNGNNYTNYLFFTSQKDNDLRVFSINADGNLTKVTEIPDTDDIELKGVTDIASAALVTEIVSISGYDTNTTVTNGVDASGMTKPFTNETVITNFVSSFFTTNYVFTAGNRDNGISTFSINESGEVAHVSRIKQPITELSGVRSIATVQVGNSTLLIAGSRSRGTLNGQLIAINHLSTFKVSSNGELVFLRPFPETDITQTAGGVRKITSAKIGNDTYIFVFGLGIDEVRMYRVTEEGDLTSRDTIKYGNSSDYDLRGIVDLATARVGNTTYLFTAATTNANISTFKVEPAGFSYVTSINDSDVSSFSLTRINGISTVKVGNSTYLLATNPSDNSISMFGIADDGRLYNVDNVMDDATLKLEKISSSVITSQENGITYLFTAGNDDSGISVFQVKEN